MFGFYRRRFSALFASSTAYASILFLTILGTTAETQAAPLPATDPLYKTIAALDTALFDASNHCDLTKLASFFTEDLEFYHDQSGLSTGSADLVQKTKNNICGKMVRELVPGSMSVYPLPGYGAIEIGTHRFLHPGNPNDIGQAQFIHVWQHKNDTWKIARVVSYDH